MKTYTTFLNESANRKAIDLLDFYREILVSAGFEMDPMPKTNSPVPDWENNPSTMDNPYSIFGEYGKESIVLFPLRQGRDISIYVGKTKKPGSEVPISDESDLIRYISQNIKGIKKAK